MSSMSRKWKVVGPRGVAATQLASRQSQTVEDLPKGSELIGTGRIDGDRVEVEMPPEMRSKHRTGWVSLRRAADGLTLIEPTAASYAKSPMNSPRNSMRPTTSIATPSVAPAVSEAGYGSIRSGSPDGMCGYKTGEVVWSLIDIQQNGNVIVASGSEGVVVKRHQSTYGKLSVRFEGRLCNVFATSITNKLSVVHKQSTSKPSVQKHQPSPFMTERRDSSRSSRSTSDNTSAGANFVNQQFHNNHTNNQRGRSNNVYNTTTDYYTNNGGGSGSGGGNKSSASGYGPREDIDPIQQLLERDPTASRIVASLSTKYISGVLDDVGYEEALESVLGEGFREAIRQRVSAERPRLSASPSPYRASIPSPHVQQSQRRHISVPRHVPSSEYYERQDNVYSQSQANMSPFPAEDDFPAQTPSSVQREVARLQDTDPAKFKIFQDISKGYLAGTLPADKYRLALSELFGQSASPARSRAGYGSASGTPRRVSPPRR